MLQGIFLCHVASVCWLTVLTDTALKSNQKPPMLIYWLWLSLGSRKNVEHESLWAWKWQKCFAEGNWKRTYSCLGSWSALQREAQGDCRLSSWMMQATRWSKTRSPGFCYWRVIMTAIHPGACAAWLNREMHLKNANLGMHLLLGVCCMINLRDRIVVGAKCSYCSVGACTLMENYAMQTVNWKYNMNSLYKALLTPCI